jgi:hypothetical protein
MKHLKILECLQTSKVLKPVAKPVRSWNCLRFDENLETSQV